MSENWTLAGIRVGMPTIDTIDDRTTVRVTARALMVQEDRPRNAFGRQEIRAGGYDEALDATVVLTDEDGDLPDERLEASDVKVLVTRIIDRAIVEAREAARALIEALAAEPPAPTFDTAALRAAYRLGYDRGACENDGDPAGDSVDSAPFR
ncbi:hypothetical protein MKK68_21120 [Methylobacterium sp. E-016]|uniref:hypothetical protein n=1 Tax=Methylobacterium sp. E-016 TaxID=2836556 RepID=UPI001FBB4FEE|nr:hypothetical protein [Methylobacterium sp. E-016]MCJ2078115.1 hypothetical protein [Methylobacterium sp. E-016]